jgi:tRNA dimethylallyltransferase
VDKVIVITGPTASGKTDLAVEFALRVDGEIISADSMQIYKYMNIGTAKPSMHERKGIPHHLIDIIYPDEEYSVAQFQQDAKSKIKEIIGRGRVPIVAGGTGLYINSLVYNITFSETITDWELRKKLQDIAIKEGAGALHKRLSKVDPKSAAAIHPNNVKRVIRALEVFETTGKTISQFQRESRLSPPEYDYRVFGLYVERDVLYKRIENRVDKMMKMGLYEEVKGILKLGYSRDLVSLQGIGYKEIIMAIEGFYSVEEAVEQIKKGTRRLAKRQMTWFRKTEGLKWLHIDVSDQRAMIKLLSENLNIDN